MSFEVVDGRVATIRSVVNPDKLGHLGPVESLREVMDEAAGSRLAMTPEPPRCQLVGRRRRAGERVGSVRSQAVEEQRQVAMAELAGPRASPSRIDDTCSRISDRSSTTTSARRPPAAFVRSTIRSFSSAARTDIAYSSSFGANVPARFIVIATVCASRSLAMNAAKASHGSRSSATAASASSR